MSRLASAFCRSYSTIVLFGLAGVVWFGALFRAAHDLWAACAIYGTLSLLLLIFCAGRTLDRQPIRLPLIIPTALLLIAGLASLTASYDYPATRLECWNLFFCWIAFCLLVNVLQQNIDREYFLCACAGVLIPLALFCIYQAITIPQHVMEIVHGNWDFPATLINSNVLVGFAINFFLPSLFFVKRDKRMVHLGAAGLVVLALGRSFWGYVAVMAGLLYVYRSALRTFVLRHRTTALLLGAVCLIALTAAVLRKITMHPDLRHGLDYMGSSRLFYWLSAIRMFESSPLTGVGLGAFGTAYPYFKTGPVRNTLFSHSAVIQWTAETGLVGWIALAACLAALVIVMRRSTDRATPVQEWGRSGVVAVMLFSVVHINLEFFLNRLTLALLLAVAFSWQGTWMVRPSRFMYGGLATAILLLVPLWAGPLQASRIFVAGQRVESRGRLHDAELLYQSALSIDSWSAESHWALARLYRERYRSTRDARWEELSRIALAKALSLRRDLHYAMDWKRWTLKSQ